MPLDLTSPSVPGCFFFAWVSPGETTFDPFVHAREDEKILSFSFEQTEGDFGTLSIEIQNPRVGLLALTRKRHAFLAYASQGQSPNDVRPLFRGRLTGIPDNINGEVITLIFSARPDDFADQKETLAYAMQELPYYDPVWVSIDQQTNPDTVLESRSALWHVDRITGLVTTSDLLVGEAGTVIFTGDDVPYDSVEVHLNQTPLRRVQVIANIGWQQESSGEVPFMYNEQFDSYLADSVSKDWPEPLANIGGGWSVVTSSASSSIDNIKSDAFHTSINMPAPPEPIPEEQKVVEPPPPPPRNTRGLPVPADWFFILTHVEVHSKSGVVETATLQVREQGIIIPFVSIWLSMTVRYDAQRNKKETVNFILEADTQPIITEADDSDKLILTLNGNDLGKDIGDGTIPIGDVQRRQYFNTERGLQSLEYLILLARSHLMLRSRAVEVTFACRFDRAIDLDCRMNAQVFDNRLPGGNALGKIIRYGFSCNGDTGEVIGTVTIGCAIGTGGAVAASAGTPGYVNDSYVDVGYQFYTNQVNVLPAGDVGYTVPGGPPVDDGLAFPLRRVPFLSPPTFHAVELSAADFPIVRDLTGVAHQGEDGVLSDLTGSEAAEETVKAIQEIIKTKSCHFDFTIASVKGTTFQTGYNVTTSVLKLPRQIDLEAAS